MTFADRLDLRQGDAIKILAQLPDGSIDTILSDPAYGIDHTRLIPGIKWDADSLAFDPALWAEVKRVTRPGSSIAVFGHTRTVHRVATAMETADLVIADTDEANLRLHISAELLRKPIASVAPTDLEDLFVKLLNAGKARATVSRIRNSLSSLFAWAVKRNYLAVNPVEAAELPNGRGTETSEVRPLSAIELTDTLTRAMTKNQLYADITEFLSLTGLRWGEMKALTVGSLVQVPLPALIVERSKSDGYDEKSTKAGKSRRLPLVAHAAEIVQAHVEGKGRDELFFRSARGKNLSGPNFTRALDWANIAPGHGVHDLRHTAATNWLLVGVDIKTGQPGSGTLTAPSRCASTPTMCRATMTLRQSVGSTRRPPRKLQRSPALPLPCATLARRLRVGGGAARPPRLRSPAAPDPSRLDITANDVRRRFTDDCKIWNLTTVH